MVDDKNNIVTEKVKDDNAKNTKENDIDDDMTR